MKKFLAIIFAVILVIGTYPVTALSPGTEPAVDIKDDESNSTLNSNASQNAYSSDNPLELGAFVNTDSAIVCLSAPNTERAYFSSLSDAIAAAPDGSTLILLDDVTATDDDLSVLDGQHTTFFKVAGKSITIDLNGHTVYADTKGITSMVVGLFSTENNGHLTLADSSASKRGTVKVDSNGANVYGLIVNYEPGSTITILSGNYELDVASDSLLFTGGNEGLIVRGGNFHLGNVGTGVNKSPWIFNALGKNQNHALVYGGTYNDDIANQHYTAEVKIADSHEITENNGLYTVLPYSYYIAYISTPDSDEVSYFASLSEAIRAATDGATITLLKDVAATTEDLSILDNAYHTFFKVEGKSITIDLNGCTVYANTVGIDGMIVGLFSTENNGHLTLTDSSVAKLGTVKVDSNGANVYGLVVNYEPGSTITILGGNYELDVASDSLLFTGSNEGLIVRGGNFYLGNVGTGANKSPWIFNALGKNQNHALVYGGTYNDDIAHQHYTAEVKIADGYEITENNGLYTVLPHTDYGAYITTPDSDEISYFASFSEAFKAATDGATITLLKSYTATLDDLSVLDNTYNTFFKVENKSITIDLNGYTVYANTEGFEDMLVGLFSTENNGHLTLTDSSVTKFGTVKVDSNGANVYGLVVNYEPGSTITVLGGNYELDVASDSLLFTGGNEGLIVRGGNFYLGNVGTDVNKSPWIFNALGKNQNHALVYGGTFNDNIANQYYTAEVKIADGYAVADNNGVYTVVPRNYYGACVTTPDSDEISYFASFSEAFKAATDGATITLLKDFTATTEDLSILDNAYHTFFKVEGKSITIDLNGCTVYANTEGIDGMIVGLFSTENDGHLTLTDSSATKIGTVKIDSNDANVYGLIVNYEAGCTVTINGGNYILDKASDSLIYSGKYDNVEHSLVVNGGNFHLGNVGTGANQSPWIFNIYGRNDRHIWVTGGTFNADVFHQYWVFEVQSPENIALVDNGDGTYTVVDAVAYVAEKHGKYTKNVGFATLAEAIAAADPGEVVTLLCDAEGAGAVIQKDITVDFGGFTYTLTSGVGSTGTESNGFQLLKGNNITFTNGTLKVADIARGAFYTLIQNYSNLTVTDMVLDGTNLDKYAFTDGDSYTLSNNCGNVVISGNTTVIANNDGALAFAFDVCDQTRFGYTVPTVTVAPSVTIEGNIESAAVVINPDSTKIYCVSFLAALEIVADGGEVKLLADSVL